MNKSGDWRLTSRYNSDEKKAALEQAKHIETLDKLPVQVVQEIYDTKSNLNDNTVLYISSNIQNHKRRSPTFYKRSSGNTDNYYSASIEEDNIPKTPFNKAIRAFILILSISFIISSLSSVFIALLLSNYSSISKSEGTSIINTIFITVFILTAIPLSKKFIPWSSINYGDNETKAKDTKKNQDKKNKLDIADRIQDIILNLLFSDSQKKEKKEEDIISEAELSNDAQTTTSDSELSPPPSPEPQNILESNDLLEKENPFKENQSVTEVDTVNEANSEESEQENKPINKDVLYEGYKKQIIFFIKEIALVLKSESLPITAFTKFGFNLLVVGAIDYIEENSDLSKEEYKTLIIESLLLLGIPKHLAETFYDKLNTYSLSPHYLQMIHKGKEIIFEMSIQSSNLQEEIISAFKDWLKPIPKEHEIITVMFTDIVNSTGITQELGDEKAYELIKIHNSIVRKTLKELQGKEVKHTGDGVMLSFLSASNAIHAAILIQKLAISYTDKNPDLPLNLKIGLSSGEPIREGQDLFGKTVQIASRLCDHAKSGQILLSKEAYELSQLPSKQFISLGEVELKGLKNPIEIYTIEYTKNNSQA